MPQNAVSIGVQNEQLGAGTLGGWVNFIPTNNLPAQPMKCASTCYSVVAKVDPKNQLHNDRNGMNLDGQRSSSHIGVMYPANIDAVLTRKYLQKEIQQSDDENGSKQRTLQLLDKFDAAGPMGHVRHAAGFRQNQDSKRMDWAPVVTPRTSTRNRPPRADVFDALSLRHGCVDYKAGPDELITTFGTLEGGEWVAKSGRAGIAAGEVNRVRRSINWQDQDESEETKVLGFKCDFASPSDEGWVVNEKKGLVGLLFRGESVSSTYGCGFVPPIEAIMEDVRKMVRGDLSLP